MKGTAVFMVSILLIASLAGVSGLSKEQMARSEKSVMVEYTFIDQNGSTSKLFNISQIDLRNLTKIISDIINNTLSSNFTNITDSLKDFYENHTGLRAWHSLQSKRPLQKRVLIVSNGYGKKLDIRPFASMHVYKPLAFWFYFGKANYTNRSKTIIIDPILPKIKILKGAQFGVMRRFIGIYVRISGTMLQKDHIFFIGYAYKVRTVARNTISNPFLSAIAGKII